MNIAHSRPRPAARRFGMPVLSALAGLLLLAATARGESPPDPLADLLNRVAQLEQDNRELHDRLSNRAGNEFDLFAPISDDPLATAAYRYESEESTTPSAGLAILSLEENSQAPPSPADLDQNLRIFNLQKNFDAFVAKSKEVKYPNVTMTGVFQVDVGWFHQDQSSLDTYGRIQDGADIRRAWLGAKGSVTPTINYWLQVDFAAPGRPAFTDVYLEQTQIPILGTVRAGQWRQPFSLEALSAFRYTTFLERSLLFQSFTIFRRLGVGFFNNSDNLRATWAASVYRSGQDQFADTLATDGGWGTAERFTLLPFWNEATKGEDYLHLGVAHFFNAPPNDLVNFRTIPEFFVGAHGGQTPVGTSGQPIPGPLNGTPFFVETGNLQVNAYNVFGGELLWVRGPFSLQSEGMLNVVDQGAGNPTSLLHGYYAQGGYFLTGEHRPYDRKSGTIDRVIPHENFTFFSPGSAHGCGAWELAARYSTLDLNDDNIQGGRIHDYTVGVNWYTSPYTKIAFNWIRAVPELPVDGRSHTDIFGLRAQLDF